MAKFIELQILGGAKIRKFAQPRFQVKPVEGAGFHRVEVSGIPQTSGYRNPNGVYVTESLSGNIVSNQWKLEEPGEYAVTLMPLKMGTDYYNSWGIFYASGGGYYDGSKSPIVESETEMKWPWEQWSDKVSLIGTTLNTFDLASGGTKLSMDDQKLVLASSTSFPGLAFTAADLSSNKLTVSHSLGVKYVSGVACTIWPKAVDFISTSQFQLDFTGMTVAGTQYVWFPGAEEGAQIQ